MKQRARVTSKGRVTIPKKIRWALGAGEGDRLLFGMDAGGPGERRKKTGKLRRLRQYLA